MRVLIVNDHKLTANALQRYLSFIFQSESTISDFAPIKKDGTRLYLQYDLIASDIYDETIINYGARYGELFEANNIKIIYFFTANTFQDHFSTKDLPLNCFYIPCQLTEFLKSFTKITSFEKSSRRIMQILKTHPITSSHN